ncbi:MAG TPA: hypothetical protein VMU38_04750 [Candidatus Binatia bacterium]|nr:hypothetical protein [Candidatus Binatia bacterium]
MNDDRVDRVASLLHQAGEVHHTVFADTDGSDDDWATFYSDWLLRHSDLSQLLGKAPVRSHLTRSLVDLDEEFAKQRPPERWETWYAQRLIARYG